MSTATHLESSPPPWDLPEIELVNGVELPKMSPRRNHALLQLELGQQLRTWARNRGEVGTEWRFVLVSEGPHRTSLVPDIAFVSAARMATLSDDVAQEPPFAPDLAIEIRSPGDREANIRAKITLYLAHGAALVLDVDPHRSCITVHDCRSSCTFCDGDALTHPAAEGLQIDVRALFAILARSP
jgi:Uma2 family endonuclease